MMYIEADHLSDGIYNIKDGEIFKYKAKGGTVRTYKIADIVRCKECKHYLNDHICTHWSGYYGTIEMLADDFCSYGERKSDE